MKRKLLVLFIVALLFGAASAQAQVVWHHESGTVSVTANTLHDEYWLFLPSGTDTTALSLTVDGEPLVIDWTAHASADENIFGVYTGTLPGSGEVLNVITSQNLRSLHLFSSDPENQGRKWLENCTLHQRETTGSIVMLRADGSLSHASGLDQLRGR